MKNLENRWRSGLAALLLILLGCAGISDVQAKQSVLYGGGPLYSYAAGYRDMIRASGFTTIVLWTLHIHGDGDLVLNDHKIIDNGVYVGRANWPNEVRAFKTGNTSVRRIEIAVGSWGVPDFETIESLIDAQGTGPDSILYKNFQMLKKVIPVIDAVSYDDESNYDVDSSVALAFMLNDLGYKITLCPYTRSSYWSSVYSQVTAQRPGIIDRIDLQCYAGGGWNNPGTWNNYFGGLKVTPGLWCYSNGQTPSQVQNQMSSWNASYNIAGGFMWLFDDMLPHTGTYPVAAYASAINTPLGIDPSMPVVGQLYQHCDYGGWLAEIGVGSYTAADLVAAGGADKDASSMSFEPGCRVTLFDQDNFQGASLVKYGDALCLVDDGWNDRVSSLIVEPVTGPTAHWQFNDGGGLTARDDSVFGLNGTLTNMDEAAWVMGKQCGALAFDGIDDFVEIEGFHGISGGASRTCTAWIKTTEASKEILNWGDESIGGRWVIRVNESGQLRAEVNGGNIIGTSLINDGLWHHIAVVLENDGSPDINEARLYVDGRREAISKSVDEPVNTGRLSNVHIGVYPYVQRYFSGLIDEVRIYNRPLDAAEITDIYRAHALMSDTEPDGDVDLHDFAVLAGAWQRQNECDADLTCDCIVDMDDLMVLIDEWLLTW